MFHGDHDRHVDDHDRDQGEEGWVDHLLLDIRIHPGYHDYAQHHRDQGPKK